VVPRTECRGWRQVYRGNRTNLELIERFPATGARIPLVAGSARRLPVIDFPYHVVFEEFPDRIEILAIAHDRRSPGLLEQLTSLRLSGAAHARSNRGTKASRFIRRSPTANRAPPHPARPAAFVLLVPSTHHHPGAPHRRVLTAGSHSVDCSPPPSPTSSPRCAGRAILRARA
jgi:hypothetical protein